MMRSFSPSCTLASLLFCMLAFVSGAGGQTIDSKKPLKPVYDAANDTTTVFLSSMMTVSEKTYREVYVVNEGRNQRLPSSIATMVSYFRHQGKNSAGPPQKVTVAFQMGNYSTFRFTDHRDLNVKVDGEQLDLGPMKLTERRDAGHGNFGTARYWETLELPIDLSIYRRIISAEKVSIQVGDASLSLSEQQIKQLRELADKNLR